VPGPSQTVFPRIGEPKRLKSWETPEMARTILDASALLALIQGERGSERVLQALEQGDCVISAINISEAMTKLILNGMPPGEAEKTVCGIPANPLPCDESVAIAAARLTSVGKPLGLSLGDRICLATAQTCGHSTVLTTEQVWQGLSLPGILIETIRKAREAIQPTARPKPTRPPRKT